MDVKGKISVFVKTIGGKKVYQASICSNKKDNEGNEIKLHCSMDVQFAKSGFTDEQLSKLVENHCYVIDVEEGFLSVDTWIKNDQQRRKIYIVILKGHCVKDTPFTPKAKAVENPF